jgi:hypothetical protein
MRHLNAECGARSAEWVSQTCRRWFPIVRKCAVAQSGGSEACCVGTRVFQGVGALNPSAYESMRVLPTGCEFFCFFVRRDSKQRVALSRPKSPQVQPKIQMNHGGSKWIIVWIRSRTGRRHATLSGVFRSNPSGCVRPSQTESRRSKMALDAVKTDVFSGQKWQISCFFIRK